MITGRYILGLACDVPTRDPHHRDFAIDRFVTDSIVQAWAQAKAAGWRLDADSGTAVCPTCVRAGRRPYAPPERACDCWEGVDDRAGRPPCMHERLIALGGPFVNTTAPGPCKCGASGPPWDHMSCCRYT